MAKRKTAATEQPASTGVSADSAELTKRDYNKTAPRIAQHHSNGERELSMEEIRDRQIALIREGWAERDEREEENRRLHPERYVDKTPTLAGRKPRSAAQQASDDRLRIEAKLKQHTLVKVGPYYGCKCGAVFMSAGH